MSHNITFRASLKPNSKIFFPYDIPWSCCNFATLLCQVCLWASFFQSCIVKASTKTSSMLMWITVCGYTAFFKYELTWYRWTGINKMMRLLFLFLVAYNIKQVHFALAISCICLNSAIIIIPSLLNHSPHTADGVPHRFYWSTRQEFPKHQWLATAGLEPVTEIGNFLCL